MSHKDSRREFLAGTFAALGSVPVLGADDRTGTPGRKGSQFALLDVFAFGAVGDGQADDTTAFRAALAAAAGRTLVLPTPKVAYRVTGTLAVAPGTTLLGESRGSTRIRLDADVPLVALGHAAGLVNLHLDGAGRAATGVAIDGRDGQQFIEHCTVTNFGGPCLHFSVDAGSGFSAVGLLAYRRRADPGSDRAAIVIADAPQLKAVPRKFLNIETGGRPSFAFGGSNSTYVANSFLADMEFSHHSTATLITNCRIAARTPLVVFGGQNTITSCDIFPAVALGEGAGGCVIGPNAYNTPPVIDRSGNAHNLVYCPVVAYPPQLAASAGTVALGNGSVAGRWSRQGNIVSVSIRLVMGTTTFLGTGSLRLSLPDGLPYPAIPPAPCGQLRIANGDDVAWANLHHPAGATFVEAQRSDGSRLVPAASGGWPAGTVLDASIHLAL